MFTTLSSFAIFLIILAAVAYLVLAVTYSHKRILLILCILATIVVLVLVFAAPIIVNSIARLPILIIFPILVFVGLAYLAERTTPHSS